MERKLRKNSLRRRYEAHNDALHTSEEQFNWESPPKGSLVAIYLIAIIFALLIIGSLFF